MTGDELRDRGLRDGGLRDGGLRDGGLRDGETDAALAARRELGAAYERELADAFADRIERVVDDRVARRERDRHVPAGGAGGQMRQFALGIVSLVVGVPVTIVPMVATDGGLPAVVVAWLGIAGVNAAHASTLNGPRRSRD